MFYRFRLARISESLARDSRGVVISTEIIILSTVVLIGLIVSLTTTRDAIISELSDVAGSVQDSNQSISYNGVASASSTVAGSGFTDASDVADSADDQAGQADNCILFNVAPSNEDIVSSVSFVVDFDFNGDVSDSAPFGSGEIATLVGDAFVDQASLNLDGTGDLLVIEDSDDIGTKPVDKRTIHLEFVADDAISNQVLYEEGNETTGLAIYLSNGNLLTSFYDNIGGPNEVNQTFSTSINAAEKNRLTFVYNSDAGASGNAIGYLNGAAFGQSSVAPTLQAYPGSGTGLGGKHLQSYFSNLSNAYGEFQGKVDALKIYARALNEFEVTALANQ